MNKMQKLKTKALQQAPSSLHNIVLLLGTGIAFTLYCFFAFTTFLSIFVAFVNSWPYCFPNHPSCVSTDPVSRLSWSAGRTWFFMIFVNPIGLLLPATTTFFTTDGRLHQLYPKGHKRLLGMAMAMIIGSNVVEWLSVKVIFAVAYVNYVFSTLLILGSTYILAEYLTIARSLTPQHPAISHYSKKKSSHASGHMPHVRSAQISSSRGKTATALDAESRFANHSKELFDAEARTANHSKEISSGVRKVIITPVTIRLKTATCPVPGDPLPGMVYESHRIPDIPGEADSHQVANREPAQHGEGENLQVSDRCNEESKDNVSAARDQKSVIATVSVAGNSAGDLAKSKGGAKVPATQSSKDDNDKNSVRRVKQRQRHLTILLASAYCMAMIVIVLFMKAIFPLQLHIAEYYRGNLVDILYGSIGLTVFTTGMITFQRYQGYLLYFKGFYDRSDSSKNWFPLVFGLTLVIATGQRVMNLQTKSVMLTTAISGVFNLVSILTLPLRDRSIRSLIFQKPDHKNENENNNLVSAISAFSRRLTSKIVPPSSSTDVAGAAKQPMTSNTKLRDDHKRQNDSPFSFLTSSFVNQSTRVAPVSASQTSLGIKHQAPINSQWPHSTKVTEAAVDREHQISSRGGGATPPKQWWEQDEEECHEEDLERRKRYAIKSVWIQSTFASIIAAFGSIGAGNAIYLHLPAVRISSTAHYTPPAPSTVMSDGTLMEHDGGSAALISVGWGWLCSPSQLDPFLLSFFGQLGITTVLVTALLFLLKRFFRIDIAHEWADELSDKRFCYPFTSSPSLHFHSSSSFLASLKRKKVFLAIFIIQPIQICFFLGQWNLAYMLQSEVRGIAESPWAEMFPPCPE